MSDLRKAAEMALEALRNAEIVKMEQLEAMYALQEALAQPEQEPLVWMNKYGHVSSEQTEEYNAPLYTAPPKREWVGLTDEEISEVLGSDIHLENSGELQFIRAIEAKLKEKNT